MWFFMSVCVVLVFLFCMALLYVRVHDTRRTITSNERLSERTSEEAMTVLQNNARLQLAAYEYGTKQVGFAQQVMELHSQGKWEGPADELMAACIRQLDGVQPPPGAPKMAIQATMPDLSGQPRRLSYLESLDYERSLRRNRTATFNDDERGYDHYLNRIDMGRF